MTGDTLVRRALRAEGAMLPVFATALLFAVVGRRWLAILPDVTLSSFAFAWLFGMIVVGSMSVVRHADRLAEILGEPYGTLILTLSVAAIEIMTLGIVMTTGEPNPALARDTMFSVVMLVLNGLIGLSLILGALRYKEQDYNLRGANAYLSVIVSLAVFGLVVPNFTFTTPGPTFSGVQEGFLIVMCVGLYAVFLAIQTTRHRSFFVDLVDGEADDSTGAEAPAAAHEPRALWRHVVLLVALSRPRDLPRREARDPARPRAGRARRAAGVRCARRRRARAGSRGAGRNPGGARQSHAARGEHPAGLGARHARADHPGRRDHRPLRTARTSSWASTRSSRRCCC